MGNVKRYDPTMDYDLLIPRMEECEDGDYVSVEDYDALQSRLDAEQVGAAKLATKCVTLINEAAYLRQQLAEMQEKLNGK